MLRSLFRDFSLFRSWLAVSFDSAHKLYSDRLAYKHELNNIEIAAFDGNHLHIGEGEYGQVYGVKPTEESPRVWQHDQTGHHPLRQIHGGTLPDCRLGGKRNHL